MTGDGLSMISSILGIGILLLAFITERKWFHGCTGSIIGEVCDDGIPWSTICTSGKKIIISPEQVFTALF